MAYAFNHKEAYTHLFQKLVASNDGTDPHEHGGQGLIYTADLKIFYVVATLDDPEQQPKFWLLDGDIHHPDNMDLRDFSFANFIEHIPVYVSFSHESHVQAPANKFLKMVIDEIPIFGSEKDIPVFY